MRHNYFSFLVVMQVLLIAFLMLANCKYIPFRMSLEDLKAKYKVENLIICI